MSEKTKIDSQVDSKRKVALIFGITGQTGSYLAEHLLSLDYKVHGVLRRSSNFTLTRIEHIFPLIRDNLHYGDIIDPMFIVSILQKLKPDEIYNLAAQSHVKVSFELPFYSAQVDAMGPVTVLEAIRIFSSKSKYYQAGTSEMYGGDEHDYSKTQWDTIKKSGYCERSPFNPKSPYGVSKLFAHNMVKVYRDAYGIFASNGICFNHESERRDTRFVTRKVTRAVSLIHLGKEEFLTLGNLNAQRDWGHAKDYARAIHLILQHDIPTEFVVATGQTYSVKYLIEVAFAAIGKEIEWRGSGVSEKGFEKDTDIIRIVISEKYFRPLEVHFLKGNPRLVKDTLKWKREYTFERMIKDMVLNDITESKH